MKLGLQGGRVPGVVLRHGSWGPPQTYSLECPSPDCTLGDDGTDTAGTDGEILIDDHDQVNCQQDKAGVEDHDGYVADGAVEQPPVVRSKRSRKPNSKYDPAVYDLDSVEIRGIPLEGKKNGWRGIYWPE